MTFGVVKMFNGSRGFGFLTPDGAVADLFFHVREVDASIAEEELKAGLRVAFEDGTGRDGRPCAVDIRAAPVRFGEAA